MDQGCLWQIWLRGREDSTLGRYPVGQCGQQGQCPALIPSSPFLPGVPLHLHAHPTLVRLALEA